MKTQDFASVWDAIEDTPDAAEHRRIRSSRMISLKQHIKEQGWSQAEAAAALGGHSTSGFRPDARKISLFGIDALITLLAATGLRVEVQVRKAA
jgi:predicted XRE-type DNA-binding protein